MATGKGSHPDALREHPGPETGRAVIASSPYAPALLLPMMLKGSHVGSSSPAGPDFFPTSRDHAHPMPSSPDALRSLLADRIAILDGAMGTMVHQLGLDEQGFRGERFADHHRDLKNCIDVLTLTQGEIGRAHV